MGNSEEAADTSDSKVCNHPQLTHLSSAAAGLTGAPYPAGDQGSVCAREGACGR